MHPTFLSNSDLHVGLLVDHLEGPVGGGGGGHHEPSVRVGLERRGGGRQVVHPQHELPGGLVADDLGPEVDALGTGARGEDVRHESPVLQV